MVIVIVIVFGLIIGSFLNAFIHRLHSGQSILFDRSRCVHCNTELAAKDLVPVFSFVSLGGKCRYCRKSISWLYPLIELLTALMLVLFLLQANFEFNDLLLVNIAAALLLLVIAVYDFKHYLIFFYKNIHI